MSPVETDAYDSKGSLWPVTVLSVVLAAGVAAGRDSPAMEVLIEKYRWPCLAYILSRFKTYWKIRQNAEDLAHDFLIHSFLKEGWLKKYKPAQARFRAFVMFYLQRFVWTWWKKQPEYRPKRSDPLELETESDAEETQSGYREQSLPTDLPAPDPDSGPFNLEWARMIVADACARMQRSCGKPDRSPRDYRVFWELFKIRVYEPLFEGKRPPGYSVLVKWFGFRSPAEAHNALATAKRIFAKCVQLAIEEYAGSSAEAQSELREIREFLLRLEANKARAKAAKRARTVRSK